MTNHGVENRESCAVAVPRQRNCATSARYGATSGATDVQPNATDTGTDTAQRHGNEPNDKACSDIKALASAVLERNKSRNHDATNAEKQRNFPAPKSTVKVARVAGLDGEVSEVVAPVAQAVILESSQPGNDIPPSNDAIGDLTDTERGLLVQMGLHWSYSPEDWDRLWSDCQDPERRAAWLKIAEGEQPPEPEQEDSEPAVVIRVEADIGAGRKRFDLAIPAHRWDEQRFAEQIAAMPDAQFWRLDTPKTCADCRHAQPTQHAALVRCDQRDDPPACGMWWACDEKPCQAWAPISYTNTRGQKADQIQERNQ